MRFYERNLNKKDEITINLTNVIHENNHFET